MVNHDGLGMAERAVYRAWNRRRACELGTPRRCGSHHSYHMGRRCWLLKVVRKVQPPSRDAWRAWGGGLALDQSKGSKREQSPLPAAHGVRRRHEWIHHDAYTHIYYAVAP